ncbi:MAG: zinc ribbon domain-containing protein [Deltaproteobacteria bacterium]|jgi:putative FmdB family regulatory protein|nr:zinc ribbon domain-containing protein [Deltaproteobacteria bacterium]MBK9366621.1 zinc ribbon domain-containing protein [Deltaproteobacteria bacterium]MBK9646049.1 zinc ribbon domain-containing protein [Deltaproteobacteria bacterium]
MPIYEYACPDCGHQFERLQKISEPPVTVCPACSAEKVRKLVSQTSFQLKGGGWYNDHYGLKPSSPKAEDSSSGAAAPVAAAPAAAAPAASAPAAAPAAAAPSGGGSTSS